MKGTLKSQKQFRLNDVEHRKQNLHLKTTIKTKLKGFQISFLKNG